MTPTAPADGRHLRRVARALDGALWLVALAVGVYSLNNVHTVALAHGTADPQAWLLAPIVDVALFAAITADGVLSRYPGTRPSQWGTVLRWFCGGATWTLNVWDAAGSSDLGAIVAHSVPPIVLILLAEAAPRYRQQFAQLSHTTPTPADDVTPAAVPDPVPTAQGTPVSDQPDSAPPADDIPATGTGAPGRTRTGTPRRSATGTARRSRTGTRTARRTDADLIAALADVPRDDDGDRTGTPRRDRPGLRHRPCPPSAGDRRPAPYRPRVHVRHGGCVMGALLADVRRLPWLVAVALVVAALVVMALRTVGLVVVLVVDVAERVEMFASATAGVSPFSSHVLIGLPAHGGDPR